jgi:hypothetical protein
LGGLAIRISSSAEDDDGSELPAVATSATRESRSCCASSFVKSGFVESGFALSGIAESRGARAVGSGSGAVDATFSGNAVVGFESGTAGVASGCGAAYCAARACHSQLLLRGLDELGVGADFEVGILQGGEGEARVAKFWKTSHIFLSRAKVAFAKRKNSCTEEWAREKVVQARYRTSTNWPKIIWTAVLRWDCRWWSV